MKKRSKAKRPAPAPRKKAEGETHVYDWREHAGRGHDGKFARS